MQTVWKGAISFGLLNVPVKMGTATSRENIAFKTLHKKCNTPLKQKKYCPKCDKEIPKEDIVKGYEYEPGRFVIINEEDLEAVPVKSTKTIDIVDFIKLEEVDPIYYDRTYYLWPDTGNEKPYFILRNAMRDTGRVAVAKVTIRQKEHLCLIRIVGDSLAIETMFFPEEVRSAAEIGINNSEERIEIREAETTMAIQLVENLTATFEPQKYHDEYREELLKIIRAKVEGKDIIKAEYVPEQSNVIDLMEKLKKSVELTKAKQPNKKTPKKKAAGA